MRKFLYENSLSLVLFLMFALSLLGHGITGFKEYNNEQEAHQQELASAGEYLTSGSFIESVFENWESEFLQMGVYVLLTIWLRQKGSSESKKLDGAEAVDADPSRVSDKTKAKAPYPVRVKGVLLNVYSHSLSIAFIVLFLGSFFLHGYGGAKNYCEEQMAHNEECISTIGYFGTSRMWFESFQNWQSEFLAMFSIIVLSIYLREKGSPESKPVAAPNSETEE